MGCRKAGLNLTVLLLNVQRRYFRCGLICFMFGAVQGLNVLVLNLLCVQCIKFSKETELPPVLERAVKSAYYLLFYCLLRYECLFLPLMFGIRFGF